MINFTVSFLWIVVRFTLWFFFLFSGLPPSVNSMQVPPNTPRGMSSAQVKILTVDITCEVEGWIEINKWMLSSLLLISIGVGNLFILELIWIFCTFSFKLSLCENNQWLIGKECKSSFLRSCGAALVWKWKLIRVKFP